MIATATPHLSNKEIQGLKEPVTNNRENFMMKSSAYGQMNRMYQCWRGLTDSSTPKEDPHSATGISGQDAPSYAMIQGC
jgi:hypothetical protein